MSRSLIIIANIINLPVLHLKHTVRMLDSVELNLPMDNVQNCDSSIHL
jgi:hypothetical protein